MSFIAIIPARFASTRLPAKPLLDIHGKPMIVRVMECAYKSGASRVIVATDHEDIAMVITSVGGEVCMTHDNHLSGIERVAEVVEKYQFNDDTIIVNMQGDEPMIPPSIVDLVANTLLSSNVNMVTLAGTIVNSEEAFNPNIVKVVTDIKGYALYFSRAAIPWNNQLYSPLFNHENIGNLLLRHIGIYAYRANFIRRYISWEPCPLEKNENLEQLRVLWYGEKIYVKVIDSFLNVGVDTQQDLNRVRIAMQIK